MKKSFLNLGTSNALAWSYSVAKMLVDRWGNVVTDILVHESNKSKVLIELEKNIVKEIRLYKQ